MRVRESLSAAACAAVCATAVCAFESVAHAETITGQFWFDDTPNIIDVPKPLRGAYVEIWQKAPGWWNWGSNQWVYTDNDGRFAIDVPFLGAGTHTSLRVYAYNRAVDVKLKDHYSATFYQQPGPPGQTVYQTAFSPNAVLDFRWTFSDPGAVQHYNVADVMLRGKEYAEARRDPRETDTIGAPQVHISSAGTNFYNSVFRVVHLDDDSTMFDLLVLHEYGHFLQNEISSFQAWGAPHDGCTQAYDPPRYAWLEGFPEYFAVAVQRFMPNIDTSFNGLVLSPAPAPETPACPNGLPPSGPLVNMEVFVAAALVDLIDNANIAEPADESCNEQHVGPPTDVRIFQIFDHELEIGPNNPRLVDFTHAWIRRGYDVPFSSFGAISSGLTVPTPVMPRWDFDTVTANKAVFRPSTHEWWILGAVYPIVLWGDPGDVPVPADYDGDGYTDVAIWRPSDGMWWVIHSSSNTSPPGTPIQWGMNGDIPIPGDYDGDNEDDYAVYRPSQGTIHIYDDNCAGETIGARFVGYNATPVVGDFDNDSVDEVALYFIDGNFTMFFANNTTFSGSLGNTIIGWFWGFPIYLITQPVVGDFDGDSRTDIGRFETGYATWKIRNSSDGTIDSFWFGNPWDRPVPADYDGDGFTDLATWTANAGGVSVFHVDGEPDTVWGIPGDIPVPAP